MDDYESVLLVKPEVFVYKLPPRTGRGYRAAVWGLDNPMWTGRLRLVGKAALLLIRLEDKESGKLFAECPVEAYPSVSIETVLDSARYFVIQLKNDNGQSMFVGIGFAERSDSFDFNVAVQDHFKHLKQEKEAANDQTPKKPLDLGFQEGQKITLKLNTKRSNLQKESDTVGTERVRVSLPTGGSGGLSSGGGGGLLLPPPPRSTVRSRGSASSGDGQLKANHPNTPMSDFNNPTQQAPPVFSQQSAPFLPLSTSNNPLSHDDPYNSLTQSNGASNGTTFKANQPNDLSEFDSFASFNSTAPVVANNGTEKSTGGFSDFDPFA